MGKVDYMIQPIVMGGLIKEVKQDLVLVHLHGRLGVLTVPLSLMLTGAKPHPGEEAQFYFSYLQVNQTPYDYDISPIIRKEAMEPALVGAKITEVNDTAIKADIMENLGTVAVPRRWVFTDLPLRQGQNVEFYLSLMQVTEKKS